MMKNSIENIIKENKIMVIDGSMSTPLENRGVSLNSKLWTAKILAEQPELIKQVHKITSKQEQTVGSHAAIRHPFQDLWKMDIR